MAYSWVNSFFIPLGEIILIGIIVVFIAYILTRGIMKSWKKKWRYIFKYSLPFLKEQFNEGDVAWCVNAVEKGFDATEVQMLLLTDKANYTEARVYEMLFIFNKILKTMKGGSSQYGRQFKINDRESKAAELPKFKEN